MRQMELGGLTVRLVGGDDGNGGGDGPLVVLLHGFGASGTDLVPLADELAGAGTRFAFPEAPLKLPPQFGGAGKAWWMIDVMRFQLAMMQGSLTALTEEVPEGLAAANQQLNAMLDELERAIGIDPQRFILGGFSQGSMLALDVALRSSRALSGLVLLSGTLLARHEWTPLMEKREDLSVLQSHGSDDPVLPYKIAEELRDTLVGAGLPVTWVPFAGGHGIAPAVMYALSDFITLNTQPAEA